MQPLVALPTGARLYRGGCDSAHFDAWAHRRLLWVTPAFDEAIAYARIHARLAAVPPRVVSFRTRRALLLRDRRRVVATRLDFLPRHRRGAPDGADGVVVLGPGGAAEVALFAPADTLSVEASV